MLEENLIYEPTEPNYYYYKGLDKLEYNFDNILKSEKINNFYICGYKINNENMYPFIEFLFNREPNNNRLSFPSLNKFDGSSSTIISKIISLLYLIFSNIDLDDKYEYKGSFYYKNDIYLFFNFTECKLHINSVYKISVTWSVLIDEIINIKNVCNIKINSNMTDFFVCNTDFIFLEDQNNNLYEIPCVTYVGREESRLNFTYIFGVSKSENNQIFGAYSYFTDFKNAIRQGGWSVNEKPEKNYGKLVTESEYGKYINGGVVRFAIFVGSMKVVLNYPEDPNDESLIKENKINNNDTNEKLTMRITDYDGKWAEKYDCVFVGNIELDNGEKMKNTPIYAIKKYEQQVPLSYHYIDKIYLKDRFDGTLEYNIL
jgi:hypothetical protein